MNKNTLPFVNFKTRGPSLVVLRPRHVESADMDMYTSEPYDSNICVMSKEGSINISLLLHMSKNGP